METPKLSTLPPAPIRKAPRARQPPAPSPCRTPPKEVKSVAIEKLELAFSRSYSSSLIPSLKPCRSAILICRRVIDIKRPRSRSVWIKTLIRQRAVDTTHRYQSWPALTFTPRTTQTMLSKREGHSQVRRPRHRPKSCAYEPVRPLSATQPPKGKDTPPHRKGPSSPIDRIKPNATARRNP